jgi:hypothetical protein
MGKTAVDITGLRAGRLLVLARDGLQGGAVMWRTQCSCGTVGRVRGCLLVAGKVVSCGCYAAERAKARATTHGMTNTFEFNVWTAIRKRCYYKKHKAYHRYGGRGIEMCPEWRHDFSAFYAAMGKCPFEKGSIERIDNNEGYTPENCKWLPRAEQSANRECVKRARQKRTLWRQRAGTAAVQKGCGT